MAGARAQQIRAAAEDATAAAVTEWQDSGELRHLHGRPLDLSDDSPDWFLHRMLKQQATVPSSPITSRPRRRCIGAVTSSIRSWQAWPRRYLRWISPPRYLRLLARRPAWLPCVGACMAR